MSISSQSVMVSDPVVRGCVVWCDVGLSRIASRNALMLRPGVEWWECSGEYMFHRDSKDVLGSLTSMISKRLLETSDNLTWSVPVLSDVDTVKCMEDTKWSLPDDLKGTIAVSLHPSSYASSETIKIDTECYQFVDKLCIFCDEIHWDFN